MPRLLLIELDRFSIIASNTATVSAVVVVAATTALASAQEPVRSTLDFSSAVLGPTTAFHTIERNSARLPFPLGVAIHGRARRVLTTHFAGRKHVLLVASTTAGGFCTSLSGPYGGTTCPLSSRQIGRRTTLFPGLTSDASGPILLNGYTTIARAARLRITYRGGTAATVPFVWVDRPIDAGFFVYNLSAHRSFKNRAIQLTVYDRQERPLARVVLR